MKKSFSTYLKDYLMLIVLIVLIALFSILGPAVAGRSFFNFSNLLTMLNQNAYLVILGVGITFIMLGGGMDLSTGFLISTVGMAMALIEGSSNVVVAVICGILLAVLLSAFNGVMYSWLKVFPFIITLGTQYILNGVTYLLTDGISKTTYVSAALKNIGGFNIRIGSGALKTGVLVMIAAVLVGSFILNKTYFGRNVYALGSNPDAVALSGVSVAKMRILIFALAGVFFGIGQIVNVGTTGGAVNQGLGIGAEFTVMAGAMLGGILLGVIEIFAKAYISTQLSDAIVFAVLIVVLLVKPAGLLGKQVREKV